MDDYIAYLPPERKEIDSPIRDVIVDNLPEGYSETMSMRVINYEIPFEEYPHSYNGSALSYFALGNGKSYVSLHISCYYDPQKMRKRIRTGFERAGKKLDMGKSCIRFRRLEDVALDTIAEAVASTPRDVMIAEYEESRK